VSTAQDQRLSVAAILDVLAPGPELDELLEDLSPAALTGDDLSAYLRACARQQARADARAFTAMHHLGRARARPAGRGLVDRPAAVVFGAVVVAIDEPEAPVQAGAAEGVVEGVVEVGGLGAASAGRGDAAAVADPGPAVDLDPRPSAIQVGHRLGRWPALGG
jgi:hypothetical protein